MIRRGTLLLMALTALCPAAVRAADVEKATEAELRRQIDDLKKELEKQRALAEALRDLAEMKQRLAALEQRVDTMAKDRQTRVSRAFPDTGVIRLENRLGMPATIIVNGTPYRLNPYQSRDLISQPAGSFTFEALVDGYGSLAPQATRVLQANQIYSLFTYLP